MPSFIKIFCIIFVVAVVAFLVWAGKHGGFSTKRNSLITLRYGEESILSTEIVWFRKNLYLHRNLTPRGVLDTTNQRVVYTREHGEKGEFALEKDEIDLVEYEGGMRVSIHAKDGTVYSFNTLSLIHI